MAAHTFGRKPGRLQTTLKACLNETKCTGLFGIKLNFLIVVCIRMCSGFVLETGMFSLLLSSSYTLSSLFLSLTYHTSKEVGAAQGVGRGHTGTAEHN